MQISINQINQKSDAALKIVNAAQDFYQGSRKSVGALISNILLITFGLPLLAILFSIIVFRLKRKVKNVDLNINNAKDYTRIRKSYDKVTNELLQIDVVTNKKAETDLVSRIFIFFLKRTSSVMRIYQGNMKNAIDKLDDNIVIDYKGFRQIPEGEIWEHRNKNYEYLI